MPDIALPVTSLTAIFAGALLLLLTVQVVRLRRRGGVVLGDNNDRALAKAIRGHGNAAGRRPRCGTTGLAYHFAPNTLG
jgi:uncharacterized membrane protein YecN with MAPEG domain